MTFTEKTAEVYVPDGCDDTGALARTTHMAIGAHQDDLEIMAYQGIHACFQRDGRWFCGVVVTNGRGSPRAGVYGRYSDDEMQTVRRKEQIKAALVGDYGAQILLDQPSSAVKDSANSGPVDDLEQLLRAASPKVVYTHNLADKHDTHVGVALKTIAAIRRLPLEQRPKELYGCEVWRDLDWMVDDDKVAFDVSEDVSLQAALLGVFDSQIAGGKRYDLATLGRRRAHATYHASHSTDAATGLCFAMDLTPLVLNDAMDPAEYTLGLLRRFENDVAERFKRIGG